VNRNRPVCIIAFVVLTTALGCGKKQDVSKSPVVGEWYVPRRDTSKPIPAGFSPVFFVLKADGTSYIYRRDKKPFVHRTWTQEGRTITFKSDAAADGLPAYGVGIANALADKSMRSIGTLSPDGSTLTMNNTINLGSAQERTTTVVYQRWKGIFK
jgi:hypothetical protein